MAGASREEDLYLTTQVADMGSSLEEALRDQCQLVEALNAACVALNATEVEVKVGRVAAAGPRLAGKVCVLGWFSFSN